MKKEIKLVRKECQNAEGKYCNYLDADEDFSGNVVAYCIYSTIECNPSFEG